MPGIAIRDHCIGDYKSRKAGARSVYQSHLLPHQYLLYQYHLPEVIVGMLYDAMQIAIVAAVFFVGKVFGECCVGEVLNERGKCLDIGP